MSDIGECGHKKLPWSLCGTCEELTALKAQLAEARTALSEQVARTIERVSERDTARNALADKEQALAFVRSERNAAWASLASMTAERDALRELAALPGTVAKHVRAERERERAKVTEEMETRIAIEQERLKTIIDQQIYGGYARPSIIRADALADVSRWVKALRAIHRPPAEPKPGDGEGTT